MKILPLLLGIFSDVNMLSLIYAAELCYWIRLVDEKNQFFEMAFDPSSVGKRLASQYIRVAEGPLKESQWDTKQAVIIRNHLQ